MEATTLFDLWRSNQINLVLQSSFGGIERLSVWVSINGEQTTLHAQELLRFFNELAGTQHSLEALGGNLHEEAPDGSWRLDMPYTGCGCWTWAAIAFPSMPVMNRWPSFWHRRWSSPDSSSGTHSYLAPTAWASMRGCELY